MLLLLLGLATIAAVVVDTLGARHLRQWFLVGLNSAETSPTKTATATLAQAEETSHDLRSRAAGIAPALAEKDTGEDPASSSSDRSPTKTLLSPAQARQVMRERRRYIDCEISRNTSPIFAEQREQNEWRWLPPELAQAERQGFQDAIGRLRQDCPLRPDDAALRLRLREQRDAELSAAAQAGDLLARFRVEPRRERTPESEARIRALLYDMLFSGDPEVIAEIGMADWWLNASDDEAANSAAMLRVPLWQLLACDMGLDCRQGSAIFDRECTQNSQACSSPDLAASLRQRYPDALWTPLQAQRAAWLARIRSGQIAELFDPPPPPDGGP